MVYFAYRFAREDTRVLQAKAPIGVTDSGVGGLTLVRRLRQMLPGEDIIYFGDSANCPYGNRSMDEIFRLSSNMLRYLGAQGVKCLAMACNTTSTIVTRLQPCFDFRLIDIITPAAAFVARDGLTRVGLIATEFTVSTGAYDRLIHERLPDCRVVSKGSPLLAALIDRGDFDQRAIDTEIRTQVDDILARERVEHLILACTHYPIVEENFRRCYPQLRLIDPALEQAAAVRDYLASEHALNDSPRGTLTICTSGEPRVFSDVALRLGLDAPDEVRVVRL